MLRVFEPHVREASREERDMSVRPIPEGYSSVTPYLIVTGAAQALDYYKIAFDAQELMRFPGPDGNIAHAEIQIGNARVMLADESPQITSLPASAAGCMRSQRARRR
jgi:PhnB protein